MLKTLDITFKGAEFRVTGSYYFQVQTYYEPGYEDFEIEKIEAGGEDLTDFFDECGLLEEVIEHILVKELCRL